MAINMCVFTNMQIHGLLQTQDHKHLQLREAPTGPSEMHGKRFGTHNRGAKEAASRRERQAQVMGMSKTPNHLDLPPALRTSP